VSELVATTPALEPGARLPRGAAVGCAALAVPPKLVPNAPIAERLGVDERWIESRTGVLERHVLADGERLSDLAAEAGTRALARAGLDARDVDLVLVATTSQDEVTPSTAPLAAGRMGAVNAAAMDIGAACTAFISALSAAAAQVESGRADTAVVIGADALTRFVDPGDRRTAALFGDGAGAVVMTAADAGRIGPVVLRSDGDKLDLICADRGGTLYMQGHETFVHATARMSEVTLETLERAGLGLDDVDLFVYHQANRRILQAVGMRVLLGAFGAGFTWGGALIEWGRDGA
jgi:3-oxoacyl-[acyl-carrier-protein] synthase-3